MLIRSVLKSRYFTFCTQTQDIAKKQAEWSKIAERKIQEQAKYLDQHLTEHQKMRVTLIADACLELDMYEMQCLLAMSNENAILANGIGLCDLNMSWPAFKQFETPSWPGESAEQIENNLKALFDGQMPDLKSIFGGMGGGIGQAAPVQQVEAPKAVQEEVKQEKQAYDMELTAIDAAQKIKIIKEVRQIFNLGLKDAKDLVEKAPCTLAKAIPKEKADELVISLTALGCTVKLI